jgi:hypothetical protein
LTAFTREIPKSDAIKIVSPEEVSSLILFAVLSVLLKISSAV